MRWISKVSGRSSIVSILMLLCEVLGRYFSIARLS